MRDHNLSKDVLLLPGLFLEKWKILFCHLEYWDLTFPIPQGHQDVLQHNKHEAIPQQATWSYKDQVEKHDMPNTIARILIRPAMNIHLVFWYLASGYCLHMLRNWTHEIIIAIKWPQTNFLLRGYRLSESTVKL